MDTTAKMWQLALYQISENLTHCITLESTVCILEKVIYWTYVKVGILVFLAELMGVFD